LKIHKVDVDRQIRIDRRPPCCSSRQLRRVLRFSLLGFCFDPVGVAKILPRCVFLDQLDRDFSPTPGCRVFSEGPPSGLEIDELFGEKPVFFVHLRFDVEIEFRDPFLVISTWSFRWQAEARPPVPGNEHGPILPLRIFTGPDDVVSSKQSISASLCSGRHDFLSSGSCMQSSCGSFYFRLVILKFQMPEVGAFLTMATAI
jgi:hypothetical protein